jgi:hypothetical protein
VGFDVLTTCQPSTVCCSRERLPAAAAQPAKVRQSCSATDYYYYYYYYYYINKARLAVPLQHAMKALGGRGCIAPTQSRLWHYMGVSGQRHTPPRKGLPGTHCTGGWVGPRASLEEKSFRLCQGSNLDCPVVQPVARHYTDWATRLTLHQ